MLPLDLIDFLINTSGGVNSLNVKMCDTSSSLGFIRPYIFKIRQFYCITFWLLPSNEKINFLCTCNIWNIFQQDGARWHSRANVISCRSDIPCARKSLQLTSFEFFLSGRKLLNLDNLSAIGSFFCSLFLKLFHRKRELHLRKLLILGRFRYFLVWSSSLIECAVK